MKTILEQARDFFNGMIGKDKAFQTRASLAVFLGMYELGPRTKLFKFLDGKTDPAFGTVAEWIERFGGKVFLPGEDASKISSYCLVPKVEAVAGAGATLETSDKVLGYYAFRSDWMGTEHVSERNAVLMDIRGDSMEPLLKDGDTILIDQSDTQILDGKIYVVTLGDELRVKRVQKSMRGYVLRSENPRYADIQIEGADLELFKVHGRVRWCGKML